MCYKRAEVSTRILVVEDEASLAKPLTSSIAEAGYAVGYAADGERADFLTQTEHYDGDHVMPELHAALTQMPASSDRMMTAQSRIPSDWPQGMMMTSQPAADTRVLIIDDDERLNTLLTEYLGRFGFSVRTIVRPDAGLRALDVDPPDLLILDIMLPEMDGLAVCRKVRETSRIPIVMLTARGDVADRIVGLELGADDYLPKPFEPRELVARIQAVLRRGSKEDADTVRVGALDLNWTTRSARLDGRPLSLTTAEFELLGFLVRNRGRVVSRERIGECTRGTVMVRVTDDGVGIPEGDVERVFEPFFRVDRSRSKSTGGYGLGLSICKRVMESHGGSIAVERQAGCGTSFVMTFPKTAFVNST